MNRRRVLAAILALYAFSFPSFSATLPWPAKSVRFVVPYPPGGSTDTLARLIAQRLSEKFGQPFIVENRPGAGGNIGTNVAAKAPPDGYTFSLTGSAPLITNKFVYKDMPYDGEKDLTPVALVAEIPLVFVVNPSVPARNLKEFIELARSNPAKYSVGNSGRGMIGHLTVEFMKLNYHLDLLSVSYKGDAPAMTDLLGGTVNAICSPVSSFITNILAGKLRGLAVTSKVRAPGLPNVPTALEQGIDLEATIQFALVGPAGLDKAIVDKLNAEVNIIINSAEVRAKLAASGAVPSTGTPEHLGALMRSEAAKWKQLIEAAKIKLD